MVKCSNQLVGMINTATLIASLPILAVGIWLMQKSLSLCEQWVVHGFLALGILVFVVSLAGAVGSYCNWNWLLCTYLILMSVIICCMVCFTALSFLIVAKGGSVEVEGAVFGDYKSSEFSSIYRSIVGSEQFWNSVVKCLKKEDVCLDFGRKRRHDDLAKFYKTQMNAVQSGCCKPPISCGFKYVNATFWTDTAKKTSESSCMRWNNDQSRLCYSCDSCKGGVMFFIRNYWLKGGYFTVGLLIFLMILYNVACCARNNSRHLSRSKKRKPKPQKSPIMPDNNNNKPDYYA